MKTNKTCINLPKTIMHIKHPIELEDDDWALTTTKTHTTLYSRYPFGGKQRVIRMMGDFRMWDEERWTRNLAKIIKVSGIPHDMPGMLWKIKMRFERG